MKYAAFSLVKEPSKTRVGIVSADEKSIQELDLGVDVSEDGIVAILKADLAGKTPKSIATHAINEVRLLAPVPRPRRNIFCVGKIITSTLKNFLTAALMGAQRLAKIFHLMRFSLPNHQRL